MKKSKGKCVVLCSGGLDSLVLLHWCKKHYRKACALFINYGQIQAKTEARFVESACRGALVEESIHVNAKDLACTMRSKLTTPDEKRVSYVVPNRNMVLLSIAGSYAQSYGYNIVAIGCIGFSRSIMPDCSENFLHDMNHMLRSYSGGVRVIAPFKNMSKGTVVKWGSKFEGMIFGNSWSCFDNLDKHCGNCPACRDRKEAFKDARIEDPTDYLE